MDKVFHRAASKALLEWDTDLSETELVQEMWVWYLDSPKIQETLAGLSDGARIKYTRRAALQILSRNSLDGDRFQGRVLYSSDSVREALRGESSNKYLREILPIALEALDHRNPDQAEAIRIRYEDNDVPERGADTMRLSRAVKSLTEEVNVLYLTLNKDDARAEHPSARRSKGQHSDPTANIALLLIEHQEIRDDYLEVTGIEDLLKGANAQHIRRTVQRDAEVGVLPGSDHSGAVSAREADADPELEPTG